MEWFQQTWAVHLPGVPVKYVVLWSWLCQYLYTVEYQYNEILGTSEISLL